MYIYELIESYGPSDFNKRLNRLTDAGWELIGQPMHKTGDLYYATLRLAKVKH